VRRPIRTSSLRKPLDTVVPGDAAERVRRSHADALRELQGLPAAAAEIIPNINLATGVDTPVPHHLGRRPKFVLISAVRTPFGAINPGVIIDYTRFGTFPTSGAPIDPTKIIVLAAFSFVSTIQVDVMVW
jgi:hypothetical protein